MDDDLAFMTSMNIDDDIDLSMRAPYISMSEADDLPLLISDDLMWGAIPCEVSNFPNIESKLDVTVGMPNVRMASPISDSYSLPTKTLPIRRREDNQSMDKTPVHNNRRRSYALLEKDEDIANAPLFLSPKLQKKSINAERSGKTPIFTLSETVLAESPPKNSKFVIGQYS